MNEQSVYPNQSQVFNLEKMNTVQIRELRQKCDKEIDKRFKEEVRKFKAETKRKAEKYGLPVSFDSKS